MATTTPAANPIHELGMYGQSVWLNGFRRGWLLSDNFSRFVNEYSVKGVIITPAAFYEALSAGSEYDGQIKQLLLDGKNARQVYESLVFSDVRMAADALRPVWEAAQGTDGFACIALPPAYAFDSEASAREAVRYRSAIDRENVMISLPGTNEGITAASRLIYEGINVNITHIFSLNTYQDAVDAYIRGLEKRLKDGRLIGNISGTAGIYLNKLDSSMDEALEGYSAKAETSETQKEILALKDKTAVANAKLVYHRMKEIFGSKRWKELSVRGGQEQRILWMDTKPGNPRQSDVYYIDALIGPRTVSAMQTETLFAFREHGQAGPQIERNLDEAETVLLRIKNLGLDLTAMALNLLQDGVDSEEKSENNIITCLEAKEEAITAMVIDPQSSRLGDFQTRVDYALAAMDEQAFVKRLWQRDPSLWKQNQDGEKVITNRLGWMNVIETMLANVSEIESFAKEVKDAGFTQAVLMGMGGSSLSPEVSRRTFGTAEGYPDLMVLDSTVPATISEIDRKIDPAKTLFIVSTKSGTTVETLSAYSYFMEKVKAAKGSRAGENFAAITDPDTPLQTIAREMGFRKVFTNFQDIGGRYSALSYFGMVPAAVIGADAGAILQRAARMVEASKSCVPPADNPGVELGAVMAELALEGRNKLTLFMSPQIQSFGYWIEQLVAESTGKLGAGIVPVESEYAGPPSSYGDDRLFVYTRLAGDENAEMDEKVSALEKAGQPVVRIEMSDKYDLGQEYYRWEIATAVASALLGVNSFDEPNVKESKDNTNRLLAEFKEKGALPEEKPVLEENGLLIFADEEMQSVLGKIRAASGADRTMLSYISAFLDQFEPGNYFALMAFVHATPQVDGVLQCMRAHLQSAYNAATTLGWGPRFLHSTGQLHKGGPNTGLFIQFTADDVTDVPIPGQQYSFSTLKQAQAMGDAGALRNWGRRLIRIHLGSDVEGGLNKVLSIIHEAIKEQPE